MRYDVKIVGTSFSKEFSNFIEACDHAKMLSKKIFWQTQNIYIDFYDNDKANGLFVPTGEWYRFDRESKLLVRNK